MIQYPNRIENVLNNGYTFQLSQYISKGFNIFGKNAGLFIGYLLVYMCISAGLSIIPLIGQIASALISGALVAGYFIVADKTDRGEFVEFSNFFDGFKSWSPLVIASLLTGLLIVALLIPFGFYFFIKFGLSSFSGGRYGMPDFGALDVLVIVAFFIAMVYVSMSFIYTSFFIVFDKMEPWAAMMTSRKVVEQSFFMHVLFSFAWGFIILISALPLLLGLLVTIPAAYCSIYAAWADITNYQEEFNEQEDDILRHLIE